MKRPDVVVVGAGAAGCVMAARLSERHDRSVLLLEAGPATAHLVTTPYVSGRGLGGSASLNAMVATFGERDDYDEWERAYGCAGWSWRDVRPWFSRVALPMRRVRRRELGPLSTAVLRAIPDAERAQLNRTSRGQRASVKEVYLDPARPRANLVVRPDSRVERVLLEGRRAVGVVLAGGEVVEAAHVVVCAGAVHSPTMLLRSGVAREGIGHNLHDHPSLSIPLTMHRETPDEAPTVSVLVRGGDLQVIPFERTGECALLAAAMRVYSRGQVRLASNPADDPIVEFNALSDDRDRELLQTARQLATHIANEPAVSSIAKASEVPTAGDYFHAAGSCRMGAADDALAVVDEQCRVIGYQSLVVCDASVIPNLPRGNPCMPIVMIAERIAATFKSN